MPTTEKKTGTELSLNIVNLPFKKVGYTADLKFVIVATGNDLA